MAERQPVTVSVEPSTKPNVPPSNHIDLENRDPNDINRHLIITFTDIIAEPDVGMYSFDSVWQLSFKVFTATRLWVYRILTAVCGLPAAVVWGCVFACAAFQCVWCGVPALKLMQIALVVLRRAYGALIGAFVIPFYDAVGYIFGRVRVTMAAGEPPAYASLVDA